jgi:hypothetical protein
MQKNTASINLKGSDILFFAAARYTKSARLFFFTPKKEKLSQIIECFQISNLSRKNI